MIILLAGMAPLLVPLLFLLVLAGFPTLVSIISRIEPLQHFVDVMLEKLFKLVGPSSRREQGKFWRDLFGLFVLCALLVLIPFACLVTPTFASYFLPIGPVVDVELRYPLPVIRHAPLDTPSETDLVSVASVVFAGVGIVQILAVGYMALYLLRHQLTRCLIREKKTDIVYNYLVHVTTRPKAKRQKTQRLQKRLSRAAEALHAMGEQGFTTLEKFLDQLTIQRGRVDPNVYLTATEVISGELPSRILHDSLGPEGGLEQAIRSYITYGFKLASRTETGVILERPTPINGVLAIGLLLLFWPVGLLYALKSRQMYRVRLDINPDSQVTEAVDIIRPAELPSDQMHVISHSEATEPGRCLAKLEQDRKRSRTIGLILSGAGILLMLAITLLPFLLIGI
jgi:predicted nucleic acid-binding Zn ribbon protein